MAVDFAASQSRLAASVRARLGNATATVGAESGDVILRAPDVEAYALAADVAAVMHCGAEQFAALARGDTVSIAGTDYRVLQLPLADAGIKRVLLGRA